MCSGVNSHQASFQESRQWLNIPKSTLGYLKSRPLTLHNHSTPTTADHTTASCACDSSEGRGSTPYPITQSGQTGSEISPLESSFSKTRPTSEPLLKHYAGYDMLPGPIFCPALRSWCSCTVMERGGPSRSCSPSPSLTLPAPSAAAEKNRDAEAPTSTSTTTTLILNPYSHQSHPGVQTKQVWCCRCACVLKNVLNNQKLSVCVFYKLGYVIVTWTRNELKMAGETKCHVLMALNQKDHHKGSKSVDCWSIKA